MGGNRHGRLPGWAEGLVLEAEVVEQGGGFVSCSLSPLFSPPLDWVPTGPLSLKLQRRWPPLQAGCGLLRRLAGLTELIPGRLAAG